MLEDKNWQRAVVKNDGHDEVTEEEDEIEIQNQAEQSAKGSAPNESA